LVVAEGLIVARKDVVQARLEGLVARFTELVSDYDEQTPFSSEQAIAHRATIASLKAAGSVEAALADRGFVTGLYRTLLAWRLGMRASYLVSEEEFFRALQVARPAIASLEPYRIDAVDVPPDIADRIWHVIDGLGIVNNKAKLVAGTKTLHHILPDLVVPMDREWTGRFFRLHAPEWQTDQRRTFRRIHEALAGVARATRPAGYVAGEGWRTSRTKVLDNALIAYCRVELSLGRPEGQPGQVSFTVEGLPPAKSEALSMLGTGHPHATRVRSLLSAARAAIGQPGFTPTSDPVAMELVVHTTAGQRLSDATNYLGGVADVLENKASRGPLQHLGDLAAVKLYENDRQIKQVAYREIIGDRNFYSVTMRLLT
jgi:hypothetical protein